jgi:ferrochelatase
MSGAVRRVRGPAHADGSDDDADRLPRRAVVLFNLGGPDSLSAVRPFLFNLFNDKAVIRLPQPLRWLVATLVARRRAPLARAIYARIGGASPLRAETEAQAAALEAALEFGDDDGCTTRVFVAMRYWHPMIRQTAAAVRAFAPDEVVLLPLYPQYSTTTTASSCAAWAAQAGLPAATRTRTVCCYPAAPSFVAAHARKLAEALDAMPAGRDVRVLFSAHGLPERIVAAGDPYPWQVARTVEAVIAALARPALDWVICYQSRVGPLAWIGPSTDTEIVRAGADGKAVVVVPIAFVSEHSETLVELDMDYAALARAHGVPDYRRVHTLGTDPAFIAGLAGLVREAAASRSPWACPAGGERLCPAEFTGCPCRPEPAP